MKRRRFVFGAGALLGDSVLMTDAKALTSVKTDRCVAIDVVEDGATLLMLEFDLIDLSHVEELPVQDGVLS